jgi:acetyl-CoA carboxylase biotin carboxylase subunit
MLAKLIVHARTRELAITRMERALRELVIHGVETSREFHLKMMVDPDYRSGNITIQWLEQKLPEILARRPSAETLEAAVIAAALLAEHDRHAPAAGSVAHGASPEAGAAIAAHDGGAGAMPSSRRAWAELARREGLRQG